jgi:hypothetical protein
MMKHAYLITTAGAALLAGTVFVAAQGTQRQEGGGAPGQMQREQGSQREPGAQREQPGSQREQPGSQREQKGKQGQQQGKQQGTTGQADGDREQGRQGQQGQSKEKGKTGENQREPGRNQTTGQGQSKERQGQSKENPREGQQGQREGQQNQRDRDAQPGQNQQGQAREGGASGSVTLTTEQRTRVRETVFVKGPRVNNVNFAINVGVEVPRSVRIVEVDPILVEYYPRYRGHFYFIVNDQIIIVDSRHHIIAVIDV